MNEINFVWSKLPAPLQAAMLPIVLALAIGFFSGKLYFALKKTIEKLGELEKDVESLKNTPHICSNKDLVDKVHAHDGKFETMEERQDKIDIEFTKINTKLIAIEANTTETKELFKSLNDKLFQVVRDNKK